MPSDLRLPAVMFFMGPITGFFLVLPAALLPVTISKKMVWEYWAQILQQRFSI